MVYFICWLRHKLFKTQFIKMEILREYYLRKVRTTPKGKKYIKWCGSIVEIEPSREEDFYNDHAWFWVFKNK